MINNKAYLKPVGPNSKAGTGTGSEINPLCVGDLSEVWESLPPRVFLGPGRYHASRSLAPRVDGVLEGFGMNDVEVTVLDGWAAVHGAASGFHLSNLTLICSEAATAKKMSGVDLTGNFNVIDHVKVRKLWANGDADQEAFGIITHGNGNVIRRNEVVDWNTTYGTAICPVGQGNTITQNTVVGNGEGRQMGIALYNTNGRISHNRVAGVHFALYGDTGGNPHPDRLKAVWSNLRIFCNELSSLEAGLRIESNGQRYEDFMLAGNTISSPHLVSVFQHIDGKYPHEVYSSRFAFLSSRFYGGVGTRFNMDSVPGVLVYDCQFDQAPTLHKSHTRRPDGSLDLVWLENSHDYIEGT